MKTKAEFLNELRTECLTLASLKSKVSDLERNLKGNELYNLLSAADHAKAEIITSKFYDKVPGPVWKLVANFATD